MIALVYLIPVSLLFGLASLAAFLWALQSGQYDDLDGAGERILIDSEPGRPDSSPKSASAKSDFR